MTTEISTAQGGALIISDKMLDNDNFVDLVLQAPDGSEHGTVILIDDLYSALMGFITLRDKRSEHDRRCTPTL